MDLLDNYTKAHTTFRARLLTSLLLLIGIMITAGLLVSCGSANELEPIATIPAADGLAPPTADALNAPLSEPVAQTFPTPAATLSPPASPTPAPTMTLDPAAATNAALIATQTAAAHPPTPPIMVSATSESIVNEPMPTPSGVYSWTLKVPILMYHYISEPPPGSDIYRVDLSVSPASFRQQMAYLKDNGYTTIDFYELSAAIVAHTELPEKPILLTFDDGYLDNYEAAFPILQEYGFKGTFFVVTEFIDTGREGYMTWEMIEEMSQAGQRIESHSKTHPDLAMKSRDGLIYEILGSQETLAAHIGYHPRYFCYPGGTYNEETIQVLSELDFWGAVTTENGTWHGFNDRFEWRRVRMRNTTSIEEFARLVDLEGTVRGKQPN
jgi:peptidoglycan/xylan/chitin deacetylase (PgdA/CDA1 family)